MSSQVRKPALLWAICATSFMGLTLYLRPYSTAITNFGDSGAYVNVAKAIAAWHFAGLQVLQFWGVSYAIALIALVGHVPFTAALIAVSAASSIATTIFAAKLWGWRVSALLTALNFDWMQRSLLGGSEPLFMLLLLGSFICVRQQRWWTAAVLASLATTVRPLGICALVAIGLVLLQRKNFQQFAYAFVTGVLIGGLYMLPLHFYLHDGLATVHSYESGARALFGIPFYAIVQGTLFRPPLTNVALSYFWIALITTGIVLFSFSSACREYRMNYPVEFVFAALYTLAVCCYNYPQWALGSFARFSIPSIPFALIGWREFVSKSERINMSWLASKIDPLVWTAAVVFPALAACSAYGIRNLLI
jgi:hypothetical protein